MAGLSTPTRAAIPRVHRVRRIQSDGRVKTHWYHRPTKRRLPHPDDPAFPATYKEAEREWAEQRSQLKANPSNQTPVNHGRRDYRPAPAEQQNPPRISSDEILHMGGEVPSDHRLPLYPTEWEIGVAVLGLQRAHEWPAIAAALEREGLPQADPHTGTRFWPAVQAFFLAHHGLDGGLAIKKGASGPQQRARLALRNPQAAAPIDVSNAAYQEHQLLTPEELCERWRQRVAIETLSNWRSAGVGPPATRIGRAILYRVDLLEEWERQQLSPKPMR